MGLVGQITSAYNAVAHGAQNWDTQLRADIANLFSSVNYSNGADGFLALAGSSYEAGSGNTNHLRRNGSIVSLTLNVSPGANGYSTGATNNLIAGLPAGFRPAVFVRFPVNIFTGAAWTASGWVSIDTGGNLTLASTTLTPIPSSAIVAGSVTFLQA